MRILALALALLAGPALAELVLSAEGLTMRLQSSPCTDQAVLQHIDPKFHLDFRHASVTLNGRAEKACWIDEGRTVVLYFSDGSGGQMLKRQFRDSPGI